MPNKLMFLVTMNHAIRDENLINIHITGQLSQLIYSGSSSVSISRIFILELSLSLKQTTGPLPLALS